jgi:hypothetical protein
MFCSIHLKCKKGMRSHFMSVGERSKVVRYLPASDGQLGWEGRVGTRHTAKGPAFVIGQLYLGLGCVEMPL